LNRSRYLRQIAVPGFGDRGQSALSCASVRVEGEGLAAEVCALYLAGAGIGRLEAAPPIALECRALNAEVEVEAIPGGGPRAVPGISVLLLDTEGRQLARLHDPDDGVDTGAALARWVMERVLAASTPA
jgi:hypothetical protein